MVSRRFSSSSITRIVCIGMEILTYTDAPESVRRHLAGKFTTLLQA
jgi:hypothetical protein